MRIALLILAIYCLLLVHGQTNQTQSGDDKETEIEPTNQQPGDDQDGDKETEQEPMHGQTNQTQSGDDTNQQSGDDQDGDKETEQEPMHGQTNQTQSGDDTNQQPGDDQDGDKETEQEPTDQQHGDDQDGDKEEDDDRKHRKRAKDVYESSKNITDDQVEHGINKRKWNETELKERNFTVRKFKDDFEGTKLKVFFLIVLDSKSNITQQFKEALCRVLIATRSEDTGTLSDQWGCDITSSPATSDSKRAIQQGDINAVLTYEDESTSSASVLALSFNLILIIVGCLFI